jgi:hypothetical protein
MHHAPCTMHHAPCTMHRAPDCEGGRAARERSLSVINSTSAVMAGGRLMTLTGRRQLFTRNNRWTGAPPRPGSDPYSALPPYIAIYASPYLLPTGPLHVGPTARGQGPACSNLQIRRTCLTPAPGKLYLAIAHPKRRLRSKQGDGGEL